MNKTERFKAIVAVHLFLFKDNKVLLARRFNTGYEDGKFSVPAGHVDGQEPLTLAIQREAKEEIGLTIKKEDLRVIHCMHRYTRESKDERIDFFITAEKWTGEPRIMEPDKCDLIAWHDLNSLPSNIIPYVRSALTAVQQGEPFSEFGW